MRHAKLAIHEPSAIAETILFLFQTAILAIFMSLSLREDHREKARRTREGQSTTKRWQRMCWQRTRNMGPRYCSERSLPSTTEEALTSSKLTQSLGSVRHQRAEYDGTDMGCGTHLTINWSRTVKADHVIDEGHKGCKTRVGVQLGGEN
jgi:hypothetical protein